MEIVSLPHEQQDMHACVYMSLLHKQPDKTRMRGKHAFFTMVLLPTNAWQVVHACMKPFEPPRCHSNAQLLLCVVFLARARADT
jgi:hypothetical protein